MKPPHARPDPRYYPPAEPEQDRDTLATVLLVVAAVAVVWTAAILASWYLS